MKSSKELEIDNIYVKIEAKSSNAKECKLLRKIAIKGTTGESCEETIKNLKSEDDDDLIRNNLRQRDGHENQYQDLISC